LTPSRSWQTDTPDLRGLRIQQRGEETGNADDHGVQQEVERPYGRSESSLGGSGDRSDDAPSGSLTDIHRRPTEELKGSKWVWSVAAFADFMGIGPIAYFAFGKKHA
jgi:hypothetical protein